MESLISIPGLGSVSLSQLERAVKRDRYIKDPVLWVEERLGEYLWSGQRKMMRSVRDNRRTAIYSCHRIGKSMVMGRVAFWWLDTHKPGEALVVTSAHSALQVKMALWREMGRVHAKGKFPGRMNMTEYYMPIPNEDGTSTREEMVAFGRKPKDDDTTGFHGTYAPYVLVLGDEACFIPDALWTGLDTLVSNEMSRICMFGNPDDATTHFAKVCKPGSGWNVLRFGYLNTPNFANSIYYEGTEEDREIDRKCPKDIKNMLISRTWVEEKKHEWGEDSPYYISKVLGRFPQSNTDGLIPIAWIQAALERGARLGEGIGEGIDAQTGPESSGRGPGSLKEGKGAILTPPGGSVRAPGVKPGGVSVPSELGVDVGGGGDKNIIAHRYGDLVNIILSDQNPDTMQTLSNVIDKMRETGANVAKIDKIGIGWGAVDRAREMSQDYNIKKETPGIAKIAERIKGISVGKAAVDNERFVNLRAEGYWNLRERFREGRIILDPRDKHTEKLAAQLSAIKYKRSSGRIQVQEKKEMSASPDEADAVMLSFLDVPIDENEDEWYSF